MSSWNKPGDRIAILKLNAELRHAQLEMLSAQCATDRLRLNFSPDNIAQHGEPEVLRKAVASASALHDYYNYLAQRVPERGSAARGSSSLDEDRIAEAIIRVAQYLRQQREQFLPQGVRLSEHYRSKMAPFFTPALLDSVRIVALENQRIPNPPFYGEARELGLRNLPEVNHMSSLTFEDVIVFHGEITGRKLFHSLVHAAQFSILGVERYTELFVRGYLRTGSYITVPLEAQAFTLESKFAGEPTQPFSVEEKVWLWNNQGRY